MRKKRTRKSGGFCASISFEKPVFLQLIFRSNRANFNARFPSLSRLFFFLKIKNHIATQMYSAAVALLMLFGACISTPTPQHVFIFGLGYTGLGLASTLTRFPGCVVSGTCRTDDKVKALNDLGIDAHVFDTDGSGQLDARGQRALALASHVVSMIPPVADFDRDPVLTAHRNFICDNPARWLAYVSTTGVYGDHQGAWVDEASPCLVAPGTAPHHRLAAEQAWLSLPTTRTCVFRLAGIYGPGRSALETVQRDRSPPTEGDATAAMALPGMNNWVSRVHVADICGAIVAAMLQPDTGGVFNVADDEPAVRAAFGHLRGHGAVVGAGGWVCVVVDAT